MTDLKQSLQDLKDFQNGVVTATTPMSLEELKQAHEQAMTLGLVNPYEALNRYIDICHHAFWLVYAQQHPGERCPIPLPDWFKR